MNYTKETKLFFLDDISCINKMKKNELKKILNSFLKNLEYENTHNTKEDKKRMEFIIKNLYESYIFLASSEFNNPEIKKIIDKYKAKFLVRINEVMKKMDEKSFVDKSIITNIDKKTILKVSDVSKFYSNKKLILKILDNINFEIEEGDFLVILGPSGSGKTTLMNLISGMDKPTFGKIWVNGYHLEEMTWNDLTSFRKNVIGYVFQRYGLLPNLTIFENVLMGNYLGKGDNSIFSSKIYRKTSYSKAEWKKIRAEKKEEYQKNSKQVEEEIYQILDTLGLKEYAHKYPYELSGGQKQRTSIARTIAKKPKIIYGDEPTAAVDSEMSKTIIDAFDKINKELGTTIVIITHDESIATYANKVIYMLDGTIDKIINKEKGQLIKNENQKN